jgi:hypothetical protein
MKLELTAFVNNIGGIEPLKKGFQQFIILRIPETKDDFDTIIRKEQFFKVEVYSTSQTDKRFLDSRNIKQKLKCLVYLNGERWLPPGAQDFQYFHKLKLAGDWQKA